MYLQNLGLGTYVHTNIFLPSMYNTYMYYIAIYLIIWAEFSICIPIFNPSDANLLNQFYECNPTPI